MLLHRHQDGGGRSRDASGLRKGPPGRTGSSEDPLPAPPCNRMPLPGPRPRVAHLELSPGFPEAPPMQNPRCLPPAPLPLWNEGRLCTKEGCGRQGSVSERMRSQASSWLFPLPACPLFWDSSGPSATSPVASRPPLPWPHPLMAGGSHGRWDQPEHQGALLGLWLCGVRCGAGSQHLGGRPAGCLPLLAPGSLWAAFVSFQSNLQASPPSESSPQKKGLEGGGELAETGLEPCAGHTRTLHWSPAR